MNSTKNLINQALREDLARYDVTSRSLFSNKDKAYAKIISKQAGIICGLNIAKDVFLAFDKRTKVRLLCKDGQSVKKGQAVIEIRGLTRSVLSCERTALNFIGHLSGVATLTGKYVLQAKGSKIYDTRKTLPCYRSLEKYAVRCGGGNNHRFDLKEMSMIKDNHLKASVSIEQAVKQVRDAYPKTKVEVECDNIKQVHSAVRAGADIILLDNMSVPVLKKAISIIRKSTKAQIEISGGINLLTVKKFAKLGADRISVGALTHSAPALDVSLELNL